VNPEFQSAYLNLVLAGFVVFGYDPIGQGERRQYWNPATNETEVGGPTTEHSMVGQILLMMGEDLTHHRVWDGMRAIDYLLTRKEVDPERIGCAGHSGGGTLTRFIAAIDERVKAAVINEGGTANRWPVDIAPESRLGPSDVEQNLFPGAKLGVDHVDMQAAIAPRPLLCLIEDFFPKFDEAVGKIKQRYELLGAAGKFDAQEATDPHAWTPKLRIAVTQFFSRWFYNKPGPTTEPEYEIESGGRLFSTPKASIRYSRQGETIYGLISKKVASLPPQSGLTREKLRGLLRLPAYRGDLGIRELVTTERKGYRIDKLEFLSEPGIHIPVWVFVPPVPDASKPPLLWVDERGKEAQGGEFGRLEKLTREGRTIVSIDVRGVGGTRIAHAAPGSRPDPYDQLFDPETACAYMAWYLDESLLGMRVFDVMRALDFVAARGLGDKVEAAGRGVGAIWALLAAALDDRIASLTGERMLASYKSIAESDRYLFGAGMMIKDGLLHGDLPHIAALAAPRPVRLIETVDQMRRLLPSEDAAKLYAVAPNVSIG
jgi:cephalosporin-C deacetylase-like acetyl esterase